MTTKHLQNTTTLKSYPFPKLRNDIHLEEIYSYGNVYDEYESKKRNYERKISSEASNIKNQYLYIEDELIRSFQYVQPIRKNLTASSVGFATIIREAANLFEIIAKSTYKKIYDIQANDKIDIRNFLTLDFFLKLSNAVLDSPMLYGEFQGSNILHPYKSLSTWDKQSEILKEHTPKWWNAYNKIKHDIDGINTHATLENALISVEALYVLISRIYGEGVVGGILQKPKDTSRDIQQIVPVSKLFIEEINIEVNVIAKFG